MPRASLTVAFLATLITLLYGATASADDWKLNGYWPFLEGHGQMVHDVSGHKNTGRLGTTAALDKHDAEWVRGLNGVGHALRLDGNDYVAMPETKSLRPKHMSVEAWARAPKSPGQFKYLFVKGGDRCEAGSFGLYTSINGGLAFYVYDGHRWHRSPMASPSIWNGVWHHVAGSFDGKVVRLYVDGKQIGNGTKFKGKPDYDLHYRQAYVGAFRGSCDLTFAGDVDEVRLWSSAVPFADIWRFIGPSTFAEPAVPLPKDLHKWVLKARSLH